MLLIISSRLEIEKKIKKETPLKIKMECYFEKKVWTFLRHSFKYFQKSRVIKVNLAWHRVTIAQHILVEWKDFQIYRINHFSAVDAVIKLLIF